jgi:hypothetical protein
MSSMLDAALDVGPVAQLNSVGDTPTETLGILYVSAEQLPPHAAAARCTDNHRHEPAEAATLRVLPRRARRQW